MDCIRQFCFWDYQPVEESEKYLGEKNIEAFTYLAEQQKTSPQLYAEFENFFKTADADELDQFLQEVAYQGIKENKESLHHLAISLLTSEKLEEILNFRCENYQSIQQVAEDVAHNYVSSYSSSPATTFATEAGHSFSWVVNFFPNFINTFISAFSIYEDGKEPQSVWEYAYFLMIYYKVFMIPAALVFILKDAFPLLGAAVYPVAAAIIISAVAALVVYEKWLRPCPNSLPYCKNITLMAKMGQLSPAVGREQEIDQIYQRITNLGCNHKNHILLVGPTGVGKTALVRALAQKIADNNQKIKIFEVSAAELDQGGQLGYAQRLNSILNKVKGHEDKVVFFFDEIQSALEGTQFVHFLKKQLDPGGFYYIAATTDEEYQKYIQKDAAFDRRFDNISLDDMNPVETKEALLNFAKISDKGVCIDDEVMNYLIEKSDEIVKEKKNPFHQPSFSVKVLDHAMSEVSRKFSTDYIPQSVKETTQKIKNLKMEWSQIQVTTEEGQNTLENIRQLEEELEKENKVFQKVKEKTAFFQTLIKQISQVEGKILEQAKTSLKGENRQVLKQFYWSYDFLLPQMKKIQKEMQVEFEEEEIQIVVTQKVIDEVLVELCQQS